MKQYIAFIRDHSYSMGRIAAPAARDYNANIASIKNAATINNIDTIVSTIKCGIGPGEGKVVREHINSSVHVLKPIEEKSYITNGASTPLFDSVGEAITLLSSVPDADSLDVSFLVMVTTDGQENSSSEKWKRGLASEMERLHATDRWSFVFRVPKGYKSALVKLGVHEGNILEWVQTESGFKAATAANDLAVNEYFSLRASGGRSTTSFYSNLKNVKAEDVKAALVDISSEVRIIPVDVPNNIESFCRDKTGDFRKGTSLYELVKYEKVVQDHKVICIRDKATGSVYSGIAARDLLGLPHQGNISLSPGDHGGYEIYIQSTSNNRKLPINSKLMIWTLVRRM
jgi:hypothetical protein